MIWGTIIFGNTHTWTDFWRENHGCSWRVWWNGLEEVGIQLAFGALCHFRGGANSTPFFGVCQEHLGHFPWRFVSLPECNSYTVEILKTRFVGRLFLQDLGKQKRTYSRWGWLMSLLIGQMYHKQLGKYETLEACNKKLRSKLTSKPHPIDEMNRTWTSSISGSTKCHSCFASVYFYTKCDTKNHMGWKKTHGSWIEAFVFFIEHVHSLKLTSRPPKHGGWETIFLLGPSAYFQGRTVREGMFFSPLPAMLLCWEWNYDYLMKPRRGLWYDFRLYNTWWCSLVYLALETSKQVQTCNFGRAGGLDQTNICQAVCQVRLAGVGNLSYQTMTWFSSRKAYLMFG